VVEWNGANGMGSVFLYQTIQAGPKHGKFGPARA
jgi:hypothetical protein